MKKILAMMGAIGLVTTSAATVVACGNNNESEPSPLTKLDQIITNDDLLIQETSNEKDKITEKEIFAELKEKNPTLEVNQITVDLETLVENDNQEHNAEFKITISAKEDSSDYSGNKVVYLKYDKRKPIRDLITKTNFSEYKVFSNDAKVGDELLKVFKRENPALNEANPEPNFEITMATNGARIVVNSEDENYRGEVTINFEAVLKTLDIGEITYEDYKDNLQDRIAEGLNLNPTDFIINEGENTLATPTSFQLAFVTITGTATPESKLIGSQKVIFKLNNDQYWFDFLIQNRYLGTMKSPAEKSDVLNRIITLNPRFDDGKIRSYLDAIKEQIIISNTEKTATLLLTGQNHFMLINPTEDNFVFYLTDNPNDSQN